jgi:hypothetical protein
VIPDWVPILLSILALLISGFSLWQAHRVAERDTAKLEVSASWTPGDDVLWVSFVNAGRRPLTVKAAGFSELQDPKAPASHVFHRIPPFTGNYVQHGQPPFTIRLPEADHADRQLDPIALIRERGQGPAPRYIFADDSTGNRVWAPLPFLVADMLSEIARWDRVWQEDPVNEYGIPMTPTLAQLAEYVRTQESARRP